MNTQKSPNSAALLAIGTEVSSGQIVNSNSSLIAKRLTTLGFEVEWHFAVPDDRTLMLEALTLAKSKATHLFTIGGLGPTTDDFTREVIAEFAGEKLEYRESAWTYLENRFKELGFPLAANNKQQCYFPKSAEVLINNAGSAHAFHVAFQDAHIWVLPGPPQEIDSVWKESLPTAIAPFLPKTTPKQLKRFQCLGSGESMLAVTVEEIFKRLPCELGYRAYQPYVEIKVWYEVQNTAKLLPAFTRLENELSRFIVTRDDEDLFVQFCEAVKKVSGKVFLQTETDATYFFERVLKLKASLGFVLPENLQLGFGSELRQTQEVASDVQIHFEKPFQKGDGTISMNVEFSLSPREGLSRNPSAKVEINSPYSKKPLMARAERYLVEKAFQHLTLEIEQ